MRKKLLLYLPIPLVVIGLLVFYNIQNSNSHAGVSSSALTVSLASGTAKVYVDGNYLGQTPLKYSEVKSGLHNVKLTRSGSYPNFTSDIDFYSGTNVYIYWDMGPSVNFSAGYITYLIPYIPGKIGVYFQTEGADVYLDNMMVGSGNFVLKQLDNIEYSVKVSKTGYEPLTFKLTPQKGYMLVAKVSLFMIPYKSV